MVRWTAPVSNGGSPITRYEIQVLDIATGRQSGSIRTATGAASAVTVTGLTNGREYRFKVRAVNAIGAGTLSAASAAVIPRTVPGLPAALKMTSGKKGGRATATVTWAIPAANGGSLITGYRITWQRLNRKGVAYGAPIVATATVNVRSVGYTAPKSVKAGTKYKVVVQAVNAAGAGRGRAGFTFVR